MSAAIALSGRELEVVELLCSGLAPKEIATALGISPWTVRAHLANARHRTASRTLAQLVARFIAGGPRE